MNIKKANTDQVQTINDITRKTILEIYPHYYPEGVVKFFLDHHNESNIVHDIAKEQSYLLEHLESTVGTVTIKKNQVCRLFVSPQYQRNGYGHILMDFAEMKILEQYETVFLDASLPAKIFYLKQGYIVSESKEILLENQDCLCYDVMRKNIQPCNQKTGGDSRVYI